MMHIEYFPLLFPQNVSISTYFRSVYVFWLNFTFFSVRILTMMHLCIMHYTYWTTMDERNMWRPVSESKLTRPWIGEDNATDLRSFWLKSWWMIRQPFKIVFCELWRAEQCWHGYTTKWAHLHKNDEAGGGLIRGMQWFLREPPTLLLQQL